MRKKTRKKVELIFPFNRTKCIECEKWLYSRNLSFICLNCGEEFTLKEEEIKWVG